MGLAFLTLITVLFRRLGPANPMKQEIKYSQILKKYEGDKPSHLELNLREDPKFYFLEDIQEQEYFSEISEESYESMVVTEQAYPVDDRIYKLLDTPIIDIDEDPLPILEIEVKEPIILNDISQESSVLHGDSFDHFVLEPELPSVKSHKAPMTPQSVYIPPESERLEIPDFSTNIAALGKRYID